MRILHLMLLSIMVLLQRVKFCWCTDHDKSSDSSRAWHRRISSSLPADDILENPMGSTYSSNYLRERGKSMRWDYKNRWSSWVHLSPQLTSNLHLRSRRRTRNSMMSLSANFPYESYEKKIYSRKIAFCNSQPSSGGDEDGMKQSNGNTGAVLDAKLNANNLAKDCYDAGGPSVVFPSESTKERSPIVYRYYGRSRSRPRGHSDNCIPFLIFGPNAVDHWKMVGQILSSRGFSVMACERLIDESSDSDKQQSKDSNHTQREGVNLVVDIMDTLRWNRVVLVGCDNEAKLAIESAMFLAPERIAGLVLCGDMTDAEDLAQEFGVEVLDMFLSNMLNCPFTIIDGGSQAPSDGSTFAVASDAHPDIISRNRCIILGGGSAPHRKQPEQFAWVLTRFVEEKVTSLGTKSRRVRDEVRRLFQDASSPNGDQNPFNIWSRIVLPFGLDNVASSEGRLLLGRAIATALFYIAMMRVAIVQYGLLRSGLKTIKSRYDSFGALGRKLFQSIGAFFVNYGYIPRLFSVKKASDDFDDDEVSETAPKSNKITKNENTGDSGQPLTLEGDEGSLNQKKKKSDSDDYRNDSPEEKEERGGFQPFFFLDHVVT